MDVRELYQQIILDHNRSPKNFGALEAVSGRAEGNNPLCGDRYTVEVNIDGEVVRDVGFTGQGCAISKASASLMTQAVKGKSAAEAQRLFEQFHAMVTGGELQDRDCLPRALFALEGVCAFPMRVKCASLAWHALRAALNDQDDSISTE